MVGADSSNSNSREELRNGKIPEMKGQDFQKEGRGGSTHWYREAREDRIKATPPMGVDGHRGMRAFSTQSLVYFLSLWTSLFRTFL